MAALRFFSALPDGKVMIYMHMLNRAGRGVRSPLDSLYWMEVLHEAWIQPGSKFRPEA